MGPYKSLFFVIEFDGFFVGFQCSFCVFMDFNGSFMCHYASYIRPYEF